MWQVLLLLWCGPPALHAGIRFEGNVVQYGHQLAVMNEIGSISHTVETWVKIPKAGHLALACRAPHVTRAHPCPLPSEPWIQKTAKMDLLFRVRNMIQKHTHWGRIWIDHL